jgi:acyl-CoA thioesterase-1
MRNALLYHLLSGHAWFSAITLFVIVVGLDLASAFDARPKLLRGAKVFVLFLGPFAAISGTPLSLWCAAPLLAAWGAYTFHGCGHESLRRRRALGLAAVCLALLAAGLEVPWHLTRPVPAFTAKKLYVIGDSLTAGGYGAKVRYTEQLAARAGISVLNLAHAGGTAQSALETQAPRLEQDDPPAWVFLSIGGNDMLHGTPASEFAASLEQLIVTARGDPARPRTLVMQELPVVPGCWSTGRTQRMLAAKYGVLLIPKRVETAILLEPRNTVDGVHLSQAGHDSMAEALAAWLGVRSASALPTASRR